MDDLCYDGYYSGILDIAQSSMVFFSGTLRMKREHSVSCSLAILSERSRIEDSAGTDCTIIKYIIARLVSKLVWQFALLFTFRPKSAKIGETEGEDFIWKRVR